MKKNLHKKDRIFRLITGLLFIITSILLELNDAFIPIILLYSGIYLILTALVGLCLIYMFLGVSTVKKKKKKR